jgi:hypothetical protein
MKSIISEGIISPENVVIISGLVKSVRLKFPDQIAEPSLK